MEHGWIKERFIRAGSVSARALATSNAQVTLVAAAEVANVIAIAIQLAEGDGTAVAESQELLCEVLDANAELALVGAFTAAETGAGAEVSTTARPSIIISTDANGAAELSVTDVATASGLTVHVLVTPLSGGVSKRLAITFD